MSAGNAPCLDRNGHILRGNIPYQNRSDPISAGNAPCLDRNAAISTRNAQYQDKTTVI